jgi:hypothetical protein
MSPEVDTILGLTTQKIALGFGEHGAAFAAGTVGLIGMMLSMSAKEYDRAADIRFAENADIRALFAELAPNIGDAGLRAQLMTAATTKDTSLAISALNAANAELRCLLIALQIHLEDLGDRAAQKRIWDAMNIMASRRVVSLF